MNSKRNVLLALLATVALIGSGCGGLSAGGGVSPATFLLPGIGHHQSPAPAVEEPTQGAADLEDSPTVSVAASVVH